MSLRRWCTPAGLKLRALCSLALMVCVVSACGSSEVDASQQLQVQSRTLVSIYGRYFSPKGKSTLDQTFSPSFAVRARLLASGIDKFNASIGSIQFLPSDIGDAHVLIRAGVTLVIDLNEAAQEGATQGPPRTNPLSPIFRDPSEQALYGWTIDWNADVEAFNRDLSTLRNELGLNGAP